MIYVTLTCTHCEIEVKEKVIFLWKRIDPPKNWISTMAHNTETLGLYCSTECLQGTRTLPRPFDLLADMKGN